MTNPEKCPKCGAWRPPGYVSWECGSHEDANGLHMAMDCLRRQLAQRDEEIAGLRGRLAAIGKVCGVVVGLGVHVHLDRDQCAAIHSALNDDGFTCPACVEKDERIGRAMEAWPQMRAGVRTSSAIGVVLCDKMDAALDGGEGGEHSP